jgi:hypothetical protein
MPRNSSWIQEGQSFANFLMKRWNLSRRWLIFFCAPFFAARRIYRRCFFRDVFAFHTQTSFSQGGSDAKG